MNFLLLYFIFNKPVIFTKLHRPSIQQHKYKFPLKK